MSDMNIPVEDDCTGVGEGEGVELVWCVVPGVVDGLAMVENVNHSLAEKPLKISVTSTWTIYVVLYDKPVKYTDFVPLVDETEA